MRAKLGFIRLGSLLAVVFSLTLGIAFCARVSASEPAVENEPGIDWSGLDFSWGMGNGTGASEEEPKPEPAMELLLVCGDDPTKLVSQVFAAPEGAKIGPIVDWAKGIYIDGKPVFDEKHGFIGAESKIALALENGVHVIEPGGYEFELKDGRVSSNSPYLLASGKELRLLLYPVTFKGQMRSLLSATPQGTASGIPGIRVFAEGREVYKPQNTFVSSILGTWPVYETQTVYLPVSPEGKAYTAFPGGFEFAIGKERVTLAGSVGGKIPLEELGKHISVEGSAITVDTYRVTIGAFIPKKDWLTSDIRLQYLCGEAGEMEAWSLSSTVPSGPAAEIASRFVSPEKVVRGNFISDAVPLLWNPGGYSLTAVGNGASLYVPAEFDRFSNKCLLATGYSDSGILLLEVALSKEYARFGDEIEVLVRYATHPLGDERVQETKSEGPFSVKLSPPGEIGNLETVTGEGVSLPLKLSPAKLLGLVTETW